MSSTFSLDVGRFVKKAKGNLDLVTRKVALDIFTRVIRRTPVDTGRARGNWMCSVSNYTLQQTGVIDKSGSSAMTDAAKVVEQAKAGDIIYLTNTLPYILQLEEGSSQQAPQGMVSLTIREYPGVVEAAARGVN